MTMGDGSGLRYNQNNSRHDSDSPRRRLLLELALVLLGDFEFDSERFLGMFGEDRKLCHHPRGQHV